MANKFTFLDEEEEDPDKLEIVESTSLDKVEEKGKRPLEQDVEQGSSENNKVKKLKLSKEPIVQILEHPTSNVMVI